MRWGESGLTWRGVRGAYICVILVLHECILSAVVVLLFLPDFDNTDSLGYPPHWVVYPRDLDPG